MIINKLYEIHQRLNDVKGTERKLLILDSKNVLAKDKGYSINNFYSIGWISDKNFTTSKCDFELGFEKFKHLCYGMPTKELRAIENSWKEILNSSIGKEAFLYIAYYIGGSKEIIVSEVGKLTKSEFNKQIK